MPRNSFHMSQTPDTGKQQNRQTYWFGDNFFRILFWGFPQDALLKAIKADIEAPVQHGRWGISHALLKTIEADIQAPLTRQVIDVA